jgi:activating signal cointegrator complex subunit 3
MVFVHARNATLKTALKLRDMAKEQGDIELFRPEQSREYGDAQKQMSRSRNKQLREIFDEGLAVHHAGLLRSDRNLVERLFLEGHIRVLVCTATLAWGVNLPVSFMLFKILLSIFRI